MPPDHPRGRGLAAPEVLPPPTLIGLPPTSELIETPAVQITDMSQVLFLFDFWEVECIPVIHVVYELIYRDFYRF